MIKVIDHKNRPQAGFTLPEMAMVIIISGILMMTLTQGFRYYNLQRVALRTEDAINTSQSALTEFLARQQRYPCPADPALGPDDANYGVEDCTLTPVDGFDSDADGAPDPVLIGAVPITTMTPQLLDVKLTQERIMDGWDRKLTYAVTQVLTDADTYHPDRGAIEVVDEFDQNVLNIEGSAHMVLVSHGPNGRGSYTIHGGQDAYDCTGSVVVLPPTPGTIVSSIDERENCDRDDGKFLSGLRNENSNNYNDDTVRFLVTNDSSLWRYTGPNSISNSNPGFVGVGQLDPIEKLHLTGDLSVQEFYARFFCDETRDPASCMPLEKIAGEDASMQCPDDNMAVVSISENSVQCAPVFTGTVATTCPAGQYAVGISNVSGLICATPVQ